MKDFDSERLMEYLRNENISPKKLIKTIQNLSKEITNQISDLENEIQLLSKLYNNLKEMSDEYTVENAAKLNQLCKDYLIINKTD